jgi:peroxiredoxin Q/BCP
MEYVDQGGDMPENQPPTAGDPAPQFRLPGLSAEFLSLADLKGKWAVVYFYPKANTPGCTTEALEFSALAEEFAALNTVVLAVSKDSLAALARFHQQHGLNLTLLSDPDKAALSAYGAWRMKTQYGKEAMGVARSTYLVDPSGVVRRAWPKVAKAAGHAVKVLDALRAAQLQSEESSRG